MMGLSLSQPRATLVALRAKQIDTRGWRTKYRGPLAIQAAKAVPAEAVAFFERSERARAVLATVGVRSREDLEGMPRQVIVATCELVACVSTNPQLWESDYKAPEEDTLEREAGYYTPGRFMFFLENIRELATPIPCRGSNGLWPVPDDVRRQLALAA
jgi:hypothetical protein